MNNHAFLNGICAYHIVLIWMYCDTRKVLCNWFIHLRANMIGKESREMTKIAHVRAVVVGIDDYKDPRLLTRKLRYAAVDAQVVARAIAQSTAFKVEKLEIF